MKYVIKGFIAIALIFTSYAVWADATLRSGVGLNQEAAAPAIKKIDNSDIRRTRNYPEQPPTIPHKVRDYPIDKNSNKCMTCHSRLKAIDANAPMISVTHYMDRDNQVLSEISPRRYFCNQCHVPQVLSEPLVGNTFIDASKLSE